MDIAHKDTDKIIEKTEKQIAKEYKKAHKEVTKKMDDYLARFATKDEKWQEWVASGKKTDAEYKEWKKGQILIGKRWEELSNSLAADYANAAKISESIVNGYKPDVYALNHNYATFEVEKGSLMNTSYTLYSRESVERMYRENPRLYHQPGDKDKIKEAIKSGKQAAWDKRRIRSVIMQGIVQGESIPNLTKRLEHVTSGDHKAAIRNARTMMTGVQNAGRLDAYTRANEMGIPTQKQWLATLDSRTRHEHRMLDGVAVDVDEPFTNDFGDIMFPGDPEAKPGNIYNCRCTMIASIKGFERDLSDTSLRYDEKLKDMDYDEWKATKKSTSDSITKQEDIANAMKQQWWNEYAGHGGAEAPTHHKHTAEDGQAIVNQYGDEISPPQHPDGDVQESSAHNIANGSDISATWERRPDEFDFEIDDVLDAQGFNGKPKIVSKDEFDNLVKEANDGNGFIAQRTYSAPDQETLDAYRDQLYNGKWYVDCSTGGAQYGQGMYCAADYSGNLTDGIKTEMGHYIELQDGRLGYSRSQAIIDAKYKYADEERTRIYDSINGEKEQAMFRREFLHTGTKEDRNMLKALSDDEYDAMFDKLLEVKERGDKAYRNIINLDDEKISKMFRIEPHAPHYVETFTLDPSAKIISYKDLDNMRGYGKLQKHLLKTMNISNDDHDTLMKWIEDEEEVSALPNRLQKIGKSLENKSEELMQKDPGSLAAMFGYDAINAEGHGASGSYTVILNRTKLIIRGK